MIKSLTITNPAGEKLLLELDKPWNSGFIVKDITGLGPAKGLINSTELATMDGGLFNSSRVNERNIVMTLIFMTNQDHIQTRSIERVRHFMYRYFPVKKRINIRVTTDERDSDAYGYVESVEPIIWSKQESVQISIICPDPYFYAEGDSRQIFFGVAPMFEFPFSNESLTENLIEFGDIRLDTRATIDYEGDVDTGIVITIHALGPAEMITLYDINTRGSMVIDTTIIQTISGSPIEAGDDIIISTIKGEKSVRLLRHGVYTNIISAINKDAEWFQLELGENVFNFVAESGEKNLMVSFDYRNAYGGI